MSGELEMYPSFDDSSIIQPHSISSLPDTSKYRLRHLLTQIEKEFENVLIENVHLRKELDRYTSTTTPSASNFNNNNHQKDIVSPHAPTISVDDHLINASKKSVSSGLRASNFLPMIRNRAISKSIVNTIRNQTTNVSHLQDLLYSSSNEHKDVIWDVQLSPHAQQQFYCSASADSTAIIWARKTGRPLIQYTGHTGSVNSCRFHSDISRSLILTCSGDQELHIWTLGQQFYSGQDEQTGLDDSYELQDELQPPPSSSFSYIHKIRSPLLTLKCDDVISCADWLQQDQIVSASWDRSAILWQADTGTPIRTLYGHDGELTHVCCHQSKPFVITSSRDATFRLWDCRQPVHSVQIFHGHIKTVNCALFIGNERVVSSSDDEFVHIWDQRNIRSALVSIDCNSPCNRLSYAQDIIAVPLDNRDIRLYSTQGEKLYAQRRQHLRAVECTALTIQADYSLLLSGSLDRNINGWNIKRIIDKVNEKRHRENKTSAMANTFDLSTTDANNPSKSTIRSPTQTNVNTRQAGFSKSIDETTTTTTSNAENQKNNNGTKSKVFLSPTNMTTALTTSDVKKLRTPLQDKTTNGNTSTSTEKKTNTTPTSSTPVTDKQRTTTTKDKP
ncbi:unnamed protein product [Didymodactylos carnosus]|uniref:WD repeat-containing protein 37 n=1 Tax=Didymodactylos carnosus TaxID=1234261 RepID=A0A813SZE7_9BILA|nr:unnamed protein product [Didymodactylos carnosus]CAF1056950.1 unnamed protein product [Didymodactylos carnosus]CAF3587690.1 unnamed protein product [Didymodactylos carnosus]CAF3822990.1 unnamed protein product [Didymodactylos carnosus]